MVVAKKKKAISAKRAGRPRSEAADAHEAIMDAVYAMLKETSVRDLTMEGVAKRAGVGKPTLYKWWPSKAALVFAMFHERLALTSETTRAVTSVEDELRHRVSRLIKEFEDLFGKVIAELIAEGQSDPQILQELFEQHIAVRRNYMTSRIEQAASSGEFRADTNAEMLVDQIFGTLYYRMLLRIEPLNADFGRQLIEQSLSGVRGTRSRSR